MKRLIINILLITNLLLHSQIKRPEPPFWWAGMHDTTLQILCYGDHIADYQVVLSKGKLLKIGTTANPNYVFILMDTKGMQPGAFKISFKSDNKQFSIPYELKRNLYQEESPNAYLGQFARFMFDHKGESYMHQLITKGFEEFMETRVLPYPKAHEIPVYFTGSIAYFFRPVLEEVAGKYGITIKDVIRRPIDRLIAYHQQKRIKKLDDCEIVEFFTNNLDVYYLTAIAEISTCTSLGNFATCTVSRAGGGVLPLK